MAFLVVGDPFGYVLGYRSAHCSRFVRHGSVGLQKHWTNHLSRFADSSASV